MIATSHPLTFLLVVILCFFDHNGSAFHYTDDTSMPGQPGSSIPIPDPEEPPPEDGRSVYDADVFKQWQGITFTDQVPEEIEVEEEDEGPVMPSYPWRGGGHDPLPLSDPEEEKQKDGTKEEPMMIVYIDCKKVRSAEDEWEEEEEGLEKEKVEKTEDTEEREEPEESQEPEESEESEETKDSTETGEAKESEDDSPEGDESETTEDSNDGDDEECCDETCDDDSCDADDSERGEGSSTRDEILTFFGVRADFVPDAIQKDSSMFLPFIQNTDLRVFGRNLSRRLLTNTNNPRKYKINCKEMGQTLVSPRFWDSPKYQNSSQAVEQRNPLTHMNENYSMLMRNIQSKKPLQSRNQSKRKYSSVRRREYRRKRNVLKNSSHIVNSSHQNISKYHPELSEYLLRPNIFSVQKEIPYFKHGEILQHLIEPPDRRPLQNNFLQQFRGMPKEEQSRFSAVDPTDVPTDEDAEKDDVPESSGLKTPGGGWETQGTPMDLFGLTSTLSYDQCEQCLPCCAYFSHRDTEAGSFQWNVEDECKPDDRDLDVASAECRTCHVRRRPAGQGVTLTCYECAAQQPDQTCRLGPRNPEMSQYRVSARFFIISQSNETSSTRTHAQSLMARRPQFFVPQEGVDMPLEHETAYSHDEEEEDEEDDVEEEE